jgi:hypothetical protein
MRKRELARLLAAEENESDQTQHQGDKLEDSRCDFCGAALDGQNVSSRRKERGRFCSKNCQRRAARGRTAVRLANPPSKRMAKKLRFSNPLYFD